jgi:hypothetical protein
MCRDFDVLQPEIENARASAEPCALADISGIGTMRNPVEIGA